jgi:hypothetical protein
MLAADDQQTQPVTVLLLDASRSGGEADRRADLCLVLVRCERRRLFAQTHGFAALSHASLNDNTPAARLPVMPRLRSF